MDHETMSTIVPKEYLSVFYEKGIRPDKRGLSTLRQGSLELGIISHEKYSCAYFLGENKLIGVMKEIDNNRDSAFGVQLDIGDFPIDELNLLAFIDKLIKYYI